ncbi:MAG: hypothetical protein H6Q72_1694 [Firmicutes bacterium]|nr:hypothetical protein [Bacillota bacterium]
MSISAVSQNTTQVNTYTQTLNQTSANQETTSETTNTSSYSNADGDSFELGNGAWFSIFQNKVVNSTVTEADMKEYERRFGTNKETAKYNLEYYTSLYNSGLISATDYVSISFMSKAALGIATSDDIQAAAKAWGGGLTSEDVKAVEIGNSSLINNKLNSQTTNTSVSASGNISSDKYTHTTKTQTNTESSSYYTDTTKTKDTSETTAISSANDSFELGNGIWFTIFQRKVINGTVTKADMQEYETRFGTNKEIANYNLNYYSSLYKNNLISAADYVTISFMSKAALGIATKDDIQSAAKAWGGGMTAEDVRSVEASNDMLYLVTR